MSRPTPSSQNLFPEESLDIPPALPSPKRTNREDTPNNDYSPTPQNLDLEDQPTKADFPPTPVFSRTRKIVDIAARRRGLVGEDKSVSSSRTSLRIDDGATSKAASLGPAEEAQSEPSPKLAGKFLRPDAKRTTVKASLSMSDLSVIDKKNGDASSEESVPVGPRKPIIRKHKPAAKKAAVAVAVAAGRPTRRLRSASLDETKMNKGKFLRTLRWSVREHVYIVTAHFFVWFFSETTTHAQRRAPGAGETESRGIGSSRAAALLQQIPRPSCPGPRRQRRKTPQEKFHSQALRGARHRRSALTWAE